MPGDQYSDAKTKPQVKDKVTGKTPAGHPISGSVLEVDRVNGKVRVQPTVLVDQVCNSSDMTPSS